VVDAEGVVLGRLAAVIAMRLRGKHKPAYTPHLDCGDNIIVINAEKVKISGNKPTQKLYHRHPKAGFPGALKTTDYQTLQKRHPEDIILNAVSRMLPRSALGRQMLTKLKIYAGDKHPHVAQKPAAKTLGI
jgi:large subunit ribosomal protein L13